MKNTVSKIKTFLEERGWDNLKPSDVAKSISIEAAELLEVFQWSNLSAAETKQDEERMEKLKHEIADVLIYTLYLPILLGLDAEKLVAQKLKHNSKKFPARLMKNRTNRSLSSKDIYIKIKKAYRKKKK